MSNRLPYSELLRDSRWQRKRLAIMQRDDFRCRECRATDVFLNVHHRRYGKLPWEIEDRYLVTLCEPCHKRITELMKRATEILSELNLYELPIAVASLERVFPDQVAISPRPDIELRNIEAEKSMLLAAPFSREASLRMEELDERREQIVAAIDAETQRTYGAA
jgi:hypothetical protein